jgi:NRPS condensation-like uncharacterized protein
MSPVATVAQQRTACPLAALVDGMGEHIDTHLHVRIDVPGRLELDRLREAIEAVARNLPELASRFEPRWWRSRWNVDPDPDWELHELSLDSSEAAELRERSLYGEPFEPHDALPLKGVLLHLPGHDRLLLRVSHLLADGGGTKNLCYRLARAYRGLGEDPAWVEPPEPRAHIILRMLRIVRWRRLPAMVVGALDEIAANRPMRPVHVPMGPDGSSTSHYRELHLGPDRVQRLRQRWRPGGITLNDVALSAFVRAVVMAFPEANAQRSHATVVATHDMRLYEATPGLDVCNHSGLRPLVIRRLPLPAPEENLALVRRATRRWKAGMTSLLLALPVGMLASVIPHGWGRALVGRLLSRFRREAGGCTGLTNIGPIHAERLDFGDGPCMAARVIVPLPRPYMVIGALTGCAGCLDFTVGYRSPQLAHEDARRLMEHLDRELQALE